MGRIFDYVIVITARFDPILEKVYILSNHKSRGRDVEISRETE